MTTPDAAKLAEELRALLHRHAEAKTSELVFALEDGFKRVAWKNRDTILSALSAAPVAEAAIAAIALFKNAPMMNSEDGKHIKMHIEDFTAMRAIIDCPEWEALYRAARRGGGGE